MAMHTPGPWLIECEANALPIIVADEWDTVAHVRSAGDAPNEEIDANARLIAAAPDLLAALRECLSELEATHTHGSRGASAVCGTCIEVIGYARAAIAKAEGKEG